MYMASRVLRWGNSLGIRIPKLLAEEAGVTAGSSVDFSVRDGQLVITPVAPTRYTAQELIDGIKPSNLHREFETGEAIGKESW